MSAKRKVAISAAIVLVVSALPLLARSLSVAYQWAGMSQEPSDFLSALCVMCAPILVAGFIAWEAGP